MSPSDPQPEPGDSGADAAAREAATTEAAPSAAPTGTSPAAGPPADGARAPWTVVAALSAAQFVMVLDSSVMNVSISTVVEDLDTTVAAMQAAITFYTLTMAALMLVDALV